MIFGHFLQLPQLQTLHLILLHHTSNCFFELWAVPQLLQHYIFFLKTSRLKLS